MSVLHLSRHRLRLFLDLNGDRLLTVAALLGSLMVAAQAMELAFGR